MAKVILNIMDPNKYFDGIVKILKKNPSQKNVIYVTTNKPYATIVNSLKSKSIKTENILFIDCISKQIKQDTSKEADNCIYIGSPQNLTAISIAVNESIKSMKGKKMLLLDSLSILLIYNDANTIGKFSNFLLNKMRAADVDTVVLALESDANKDIIKQIESFVDEVQKKKGK